MIKRLIKGTILSILLFFSISFLTVLFQINSPIHRQTDNLLKIGFPLTYYYQYVVDFIPNAGWSVKNLLIDMATVWVLTIGTYLLITRKK